MEWPADLQGVSRLAGAATDLPGVSRLAGAATDLQGVSRLAGAATDLPGVSRLAGAATDLPGAALLAAVFLALLVAAELWRRFGNPHAEWTRKLVHMGGGLACLFIPFLVRSAWVVLALALALTAVFALGGRLGFLRSLHGVGRRSRGVEYYPLSVFLVFLIARGRPWIYVSALLVLAVGDAFAALIGSRYGVVRYQVEDEHKSLEGSMVFLVIAFLAIHLPMLLLTGLPRPVCVLAALLVAALVTGFEAISLEGADNLFVPLAVAVVLGKITAQPLAEVIFQNLSLLVICLVVAAFVWRTRALNAGGTLAFILYAYGAWSLGSWQWALPAFVGFAAYLAVWVYRGRHGRPAGARVRTLARAVLPPFCILIVANSMRQAFAPAYGPYVAASGAVLAFCLRPGLLGLLRRRAAGRRAGSERPAGRVATGGSRDGPAGRVATGGSRDAVPVSRATAMTAAAAAAVAAWMAVAVPPWLIQGLPPSPLLAAGAAVLAVSLVNAGLVRDENDAEEPADAESEAAADFPWPARLFLLAFAAAALVLALQWAGLAEAWRPDVAVWSAFQPLQIHS
jgi:dolichol kinase